MHRLEMPVRPGNHECPNFVLGLGDAFRSNKETYTRNQWMALNRYVEDGDLSIDNNPAERALLPAVIQRKLSFGTQSESGSRSLERMLTVSET